MQLTATYACDRHERSSDTRPLLQLRLPGNMPLQHLRSSCRGRLPDGDIRIIQVCHHMVPNKFQQLALAKVKSAQSQKCNPYQGWTLQLPCMAQGAFTVEGS